MITGRNVILIPSRHKLKPNLFGKVLSRKNHLSIKDAGSLTEDKKTNSRFNPLNIQMLSPSLHSQIFKSPPQNNLNAVARSIEHLKHHQLWNKETSVVSDIEFKLPPLYGNNIDEHFKYLGDKFSQEYKELLEKLVNSSLPPKPTKWELQKGWTRYANGEHQTVDYPLEEAIVFDVEVCLRDGPNPTLATAVSSEAWYGWCSEQLAQEEQFSWPKAFSGPKHITLADLIPLETSNNQPRQSTKKDWPFRLVIGHNVMFDRSYVKEQYFLQGTKLRFLDTLSLHMCVSGLTATQRSMSVANKANKTKEKTTDDNNNDELSMMWDHVSSLNNLSDVYALYCDGEVSKSAREIFITGSLNDIRENFQEMASYCAQDVVITYKILQKLLPLFYQRFPHPITFAAMLEMSTAYLPVNQNWERYLQEAQSTYDNLQNELKLSLIHLANSACRLSNDDRYQKDPWLWDLDWSTQEIKYLKKAPKKKKKTEEEISNDETSNLEEEVDEEYLLLKEKLKYIYETANLLPKVRPFLPGYPAWYRALCEKPSKDEENDEWEPGPRLISTQMRCTPKLLRLVWDSFPLHYDKKHGWGYLVPGNPKEICDEEGSAFPIDELLKLYLVNNSDQVPEMSEELERFWKEITVPKESSQELSRQWELITGKKKVPWCHGNGPFEDVKIKGCWFYRLPHKDGPDKRVGNPLSKDFLAKVADGTLRAYGGGSDAERVLKRSTMLSYWKNSHKRIESQMVVWLSRSELPRPVTRNESYDEDNLYGAILPRLITAGTVTRRAVEPTWLTASNSYEDRLGSELKSMVQSPPGYHFVGADVDSQELWIASLIGDAHFSGIHGCTAFGWMTLQGKKSTGTDMHSKTAQSVGISRDHAKILNYARIYGAGQPFAQQLLMQFNHRLTAEEAKQKAKKIFTETKGIRRVVYDTQEVDGQEMVLNNAVKKKLWVGGSESHMFNKLEEIALSKEPRTPVLGCCISRALEPGIVDKNFIPSRINWVVQSSAVDYLHLMLVCMKWLMEDYGINGRFCISIHDEVRYIVQSEDRYRAALALQITNLLTRAMFCFKVGMNDVPQSVAFFSSVDIDMVIRKEVGMDCRTPSNPHGLELSYNIPKGEALDISSILDKTDGGSLRSPL